MFTIIGMGKTAKSKMSPSVEALEEGLKIRGWTRPEFYNKKMPIGKEVYQNWKNRGVPANKIIDVARLLECDPTELSEGRFIDRRNITNQMEIARNFDSIEDAQLAKMLLADYRRLQNHIARRTTTSKDRNTANQGGKEETQAS